MRETLARFLQAVRSEGIRISTAESIDAVRAAAAVGIDRDALREALAATVVKDEVDRDRFDDVFDRFFSAAAAKARPKARKASGGGERLAGRSRSEGEGASSPPIRPEPDRRPPDRDRTPREKPPTPSEAKPARIDTNTPEIQPKPSSGRSERPKAEAARRASPELERRRRRRELVRRPFRDLDPLEAEELTALAAELSRRFRARLSRRAKPGKTGRLDFRRTFRRNVPHGGVPIELRHRRRRPARPSLIALCDVSGSARHAAELFTAILAPCERFFRSVRLFVYVDRPVEATFEDGRLVPHEVVDFHAYSDLGAVLRELAAREETLLRRDTILVVLGDARNNRRPDRADLLARFRREARALWWLNPEEPSRWNTGDSAIAAYAPSCDAVLDCATGEDLLAAIGRLPF